GIRERFSLQLLPGAHHRRESASRAWSAPGFSTILKNAATLVAMSAELHTIAAERLASDGQRYTPNRKAIVEILAASSKPLALTEVLAAGDGLAQSSVYRNLVILEDAAVVRKVVATDEFARYELAEDLTEHH